MADPHQISDRFGALAHPQRLQIIRLLLAAHNLGGMTAGVLQDRLRMPGSTLHHHLAKLERAGLVKSRRDRQWMWYAAQTEGLREMQEFLFRECCTESRVLPAHEISGGNPP